MSAVEWVGLVLGAIFSTASLLLGLAYFFLLYRVAAYWMWGRNPTARDRFDSPRYFLRRMVCRHRRGYAQVKNAWGLTYTACARCGNNMNQGRREEDRV